MRDCKVRLALCHSLCSLCGGLVRGQLQLITGTHRAKQRRCKEGLRAGSAVDGHRHGVACLDVGFQIIQILEVQGRIGRQDEDGRIQVLHKLEIVVAELQLGRVQRLGDGEQSLTGKDQLLVVCLGAGHPSIDGGGVALDGLCHQRDLFLRVVRGLGGCLLADHRCHTRRCPRAGDFPALLLASAASEHRQSEDTGGDQRRNTLLHHFTLLFVCLFRVVAGT